MSPLRRVKLTELNAHLVCVLCSGYFVDATTIIECLHTFCKTCIVRYLQTSSFCPICDVQVHKTKPLLSLREDRTLQDVVFKLVPGLFHSEMNRRLKFYKEHPEAGGDKTEQSLRERRHFFHVDDQISLSLEYLPTTPSFSYTHLHGLKPLKINNGQQGRTKTLEDEKEGKNEDIKKEEVKEQEKMTGKVIHKRYLRCPAAVQVSHLEKFIRLKFSLTPQTHKVDIMHGGDCLVGELTLLDVVYMYKWTEDAPLRLMYTVTAIPQSRKRPRPNSLRTPASTDSEAPGPKIPKTQPSLIHQQTSLQHSLSQVHPVLGRDQDSVETSISEGTGSVTDEKIMPEKEVSEPNIPNITPAISIVSVPISVNIPSLPNTILNNGIGQLPTTLPTGRRTAFTKTTPATATPRLAVPNKPFAAADPVAPIITTMEGAVTAVTTLPTTVTSSVGVSSSITNTCNTSMFTATSIPVASVPRLPMNGIIEPSLKNINSTGNQQTTIFQPIIPTKPRLGRPPNASRVAAASMKAGVRVGDQRTPKPVSSGRILNKVHTTMNRSNPIVSASLTVQSRLNSISGPNPGSAKVSVKRPNELPKLGGSTETENIGAKISSTLQNHTLPASQLLASTSVSAGSVISTQSAMIAQPTLATSQVSASVSQSTSDLLSQTRAVSRDVQSPSFAPIKNIETSQQSSNPYTTQKLPGTQRTPGVQVSQRPINVANTHRQAFGTAVRPTFTGPTSVAPQHSPMQALRSTNHQVSKNPSTVSVPHTETNAASFTTNSSPQMTVSSTIIPGNASGSSHSKLEIEGKQSLSGAGSTPLLSNPSPHRLAQTPVSRKAPTSSVPQGTPTSGSRLTSGPIPNKLHTVAAPKTPASPSPHRTIPSPAPQRAPSNPAPHRTPVNQSANRTAQSPAAHRPLQNPAPHRAPPSPAPHRAPPSPAPHRPPPSPAPHRAPPSPAPHRAPPSPAPHRAPPSPAPHRAPPSPAPHRAPPSPASQRVSPSPVFHRASPNSTSQRSSPVTTPNQTPVSPAGQAPASPAGQAPASPAGQNPASPAFQAPASPAFPAPASPAVLQTPVSPAVQALGSPLVNQSSTSPAVQTSVSPAVQDNSHNPALQSTQSVLVSKASASPNLGQDQRVSTSGAKTTASTSLSTSSVLTNREVSVTANSTSASLSANGIANKTGVTKVTQSLSQGGSSLPCISNSNVTTAKASAGVKVPKSPGRKRNSGGTSPTILSIAQSLANRQLQRTINSTQVPSAVTTNTTPVATHQPYTTTSNTVVYPNPVCSALVSPALAAAAYMATAYGGDASAALTDVTAMRNLITLSQTAACIRELNLAAMVQAAETIPRPSDPAPIDLSPTSKAAPQSPLTNGRGNMISTSPVTTVKSSQVKSGLPKMSTSNSDSAPTISPPTPEVTITKLPSTPASSASTNSTNTSSGKNVPALVKLTTSSTNTVSITKRPVSSNRIAVTKSPANASVRQIPNPSFLRHQSEVRNNNVVSKSSVSSSSCTITTTTVSTKAQPSSKLTNNSRTTGNSPLKDTGPIPETSSILKIENLTRSLAAPAAAAAASNSSSPSFRFFDKR